MNDEQVGVEKCNHAPCDCVPSAESAIVEGASVYCSTGCRDGSGCSHAGCSCGE